MKRLSAWLLVMLGLSGCANPHVEYRPVPIHLIPARQILPTVRAGELECLSDDAYLRLAERNRMQQQQIDELRALLDAP